MQLVCFPHAGGSASYFFALSRALSPAVEVVAVQYPGRQDRRAEPSLASVAALTDGVLPALHQLDDRPRALFGHSLGALVAFEVARRLDAADPVRLLFASGRRAPHTTTGMARARWRDDAGLLALTRSLGGTDGALLDDPEVREMVLPPLRADHQAAEEYRFRPGPRLRCPIHALVGEDDPLAPPAAVSAWADHTTATFDLTRFPGDHFYLKDHTDRLASVVSDSLHPGGHEDVGRCAPESSAPNHSSPC